MRLAFLMKFKSKCETIKSISIRFRSSHSIVSVLAFQFSQRQSIKLQLIAQSVNFSSFQNIALDRA